MVFKYIKAKNLKEARKKARAMFKGNLVVSSVSEVIGERNYRITTKQRVRKSKKK